MSSQVVISQKKKMVLQNDRSDSDCVTHRYGYVAQGKDWPPARGPWVYFIDYVSAFNSQN